MNSTPARRDGHDLTALATAINREHRAAETAMNAALEHARACGDLLLEAKDQCEHGDWMEWVQANFAGSYSTAALYMRIHKRWPEVAKLQRVETLGLNAIESKMAESANLSIDGALKALATPRTKRRERLQELEARIEDLLPEIELSDDHLVVGFAGKWTAIIEPSSSSGFFYVNVLIPTEGSADADSAGRAISGTLKPVAPEAVPFYLVQEHPEGAFPFGLAEWDVYEATEHPRYNRWMFKSEEDYINRHVLGREDHAEA